MGAPGRIVRELTAEQSAALAHGAAHYVENWKRFRADLSAL
jgi:carbonic anhydrase/acetyltransferase-like protein (isoleucine patch superfamily)